MPWALFVNSAHKFQHWEYIKAICEEPLGNDWWIILAVVCLLLPIPISDIIWLLWELIPPFLTRGNWLQALVEKQKECFRALKKLRGASCFTIGIKLLYKSIWPLSNLLNCGSKGSINTLLREERVVHFAYQLHFSMKEDTLWEGKRFPHVCQASSESKETERLEEYGNLPSP